MTNGRGIAAAILARRVGTRYALDPCSHLHYSTATVSVAPSRRAQRGKE